jgi:hypothetical protein
MSSICFVVVLNISCYAACQSSEQAVNKLWTPAIWIIASPQAIASMRSVFMVLAKKET